MSRRAQNHITETRSLKIFLNLVPDEWVVRDLSERDYGTDLLVEIFTTEGQPTGYTFWVQLKGTIGQKNFVLFYQLRFSRVCKKVSHTIHLILYCGEFQKGEICLFTKIH